MAWRRPAINTCAPSRTKHLGLHLDLVAWTDRAQPPQLIGAEAHLGGRAEQGERALPQADLEAAGRVPHRSTHPSHPGQLHHPLQQEDARFLAQFGDRVVLHFLPPYCPDENRIERVWLDLHANVTRNHRCRTMEELMVQVVAFLRAYNQRKKLNPSLRLAAGVSGSRSVVWGMAECDRATIHVHAVGIEIRDEKVMRSDARRTTADRDTVRPREAFGWPETWRDGCSHDPVSEDAP